MPKVADFYSINEAKKPEGSRRYHHNSACAPGRDTPTNERKPGTGGYKLCEDCIKEDKAGH